MQLKIYTVFDSKAGAYTQPFFLPTNGMAERAISNALMDPNHDFSRHTEDYTLHTIGTYEDTTGAITPCMPHLVATLLELRSKIQERQSAQLHMFPTEGEAEQEAS